jgi:hypothetical protein
MFYRKNVGRKERFGRLVAGAAMMLCGLVGLQASPLGWLLAASGVMTVVTGVVGYCPACAMVGRRPVKEE